MIYSLHSLTICYWTGCIKYFKPMHSLGNWIISLRSMTKQGMNFRWTWKILGRIEKEEGCLENHRGAVPGFWSYFLCPKHQSFSVNDSFVSWANQQQTLGAGWSVYWAHQVSPLMTCIKIERILRFFCKVFLAHVNLESTNLAQLIPR